MSKKYWQTIQYLGRGYVLQRRMDTREGENLQWYRDDREEWSEYNWHDDVSEVRNQERIVHVSETDIEVKPTDEDLEEIRP